MGAIFSDNDDIQHYRSTGDEFATNHQTQRPPALLPRASSPPTKLWMVVALFRFVWFVRLLPGLRVFSRALEVDPGS